MTLVPVPHGAEAAAEEQQRRRAARGVDGVELGVPSRDHELSGHGDHAFRVRALVALVLLICVDS